MRQLAELANGLEVDHRRQLKAFARGTQVTDHAQDMVRVAAGWSDGLKIDPAKVRADAQATKAAAGGFAPKLRLRTTESGDACLSENLG
jgi:hypothetical protein